MKNKIKFLVMILIIPGMLSVPMGANAASLSITSPSTSDWYEAGDTVTFSWTSSGYSGSNYDVWIRFDGGSATTGHPFSGSFTKTYNSDGHHSFRVEIKHYELFCTDRFGIPFCEYIWATVNSRTVYFDIGVSSGNIRDYIPDLALPTADVNGGNGLYRVAWANKIIDSASLYSRIEVTYIFHDEDMSGSGTTLDTWYDGQRTDDYGNIRDLETIQIWINHQGNIAGVYLYRTYANGQEWFFSGSHESTSWSSMPSKLIVGTWNHLFDDEKHPGETQEYGVWWWGETLYTSSSQPLVNYDRYNAELVYRPGGDVPHNERYQCPASYCP